MTGTILSEILRPGDRVVIGQAAAEPLTLVAYLLALAPACGPLEAFCGLSLNPAWGGVLPEALALTTYCGLGTMRKPVTQGRARVLPVGLSQLSGLIASGRLQIDVVMLQVAPADADGWHSLGCALDYVWEAAQVARTIVVEVNPALPVTRGTRRLHRDSVVVVQHSETPLPEPAPEFPSEVQRAVARQAAALVPDGASVQLGIGGLALAVAEALRDRRGLRIRSGMVSDWLPALKAYGALEIGGHGLHLASLALGSREFYDFLAQDDCLGFALPSELVKPIPGTPLIAINSAIELDLAGQVNAEFLGARYVGTIGGQTDYFRAARRSDGGLAILALSAAASDGTSRIVPRCAHVSTAQSDVDIIVTEHGVADMRATTLSERAALIADIADPRWRISLREGRADWPTG